MATKEFRIPNAEYYANTDAAMKKYIPAGWYPHSWVHYADCVGIDCLPIDATVVASPPIVAEKPKKGGKK